jgi:type IV secretion system protein VirB9
VVSEVSGTDQAADIKVILEQKNTQALANIEHPAWTRSDLAARERDDLKKSLAQKAEELEQVKRNAKIEATKNLHTQYTWKHGKESASFGLEKIVDDGKRTYIQAHSQHAPVLYESRDRKGSAIVNYTLEDGMYVADHVIDIGELRSGKTRLKFERGKTST